MPPDPTPDPTAPPDPAEMDESEAPIEDANNEEVDEGLDLAPGDAVPPEVIP